MNKNAGASSARRISFVKYTTFISEQTKAEKL
jgi:hypothetical protein